MRTGTESDAGIRETSEKPKTSLCSNLDGVHSVKWSDV